MDQKIVTASGIEIPQSDVRAIQKQSARETLRNVFAGVGIVATGLFIRAQLEKRNIKTPDII